MPSPGPLEEGVDVTVSDHGCEPRLGQEHVPNLTAEDTTQQDMIQSLGGLTDIHYLTAILPK